PPSAPGGLATGSPRGTQTGRRTRPAIIDTVGLGSPWPSPTEPVRHDGHFVELAELDPDRDRVGDALDHHAIGDDRTAAVAPAAVEDVHRAARDAELDRKSTRLNSSH